MAAESLLEGTGVDSDLSPPSSPTSSLATLEGRNLYLDPNGRRRSHLIPKDLTSTESNETTFEVLPPTPDPCISNFKRKLPYPDVEKALEADHRELRPKVVEGLESLSQRWGVVELIKGESNEKKLVGTKKENENHTLNEDHLDLISLMTLTSHTIRLVRTFLFALPSDSLLIGSEGLGNLASATNGNGFKVGGFGEEDDNVGGSSLGNGRRLPEEIKAKDQFRRQSSFSGSTYKADLGRRIRLNQRSTSGSTSTSTSISASGMIGNSNPNLPPTSWSKSSNQNPYENKRNPNYNGGVLSSSPGTLNPSIPSSSTSTRSSGGSSTSTIDPLVLIRTSALEVLGMLKSLEESYRLPTSSGSEEPSLSTSSSHSSGLISSTGFESLGMEPISSQDKPVFSISRRASNYSTGGESFISNDSNDSKDLLSVDTNVTSSTSTSTNGSASISGHLYKTDLTLEELTEEREIVKRYIELVNWILVSLRKGKGGEKLGLGLGTRKDRRGVSESGVRNEGLDEFEGKLKIGDEGQGEIEKGDEGESLGDDDLPEWARRGEGHQLGELVASTLGESGWSAVSKRRAG